MLSLTIRVYLHTFSCCCLPNLQNLVKFSENSNLYSSRSSMLMSIESAYATLYQSLIETLEVYISYSFRDIDEFSFQIARFPTPPLFNAAKRRNALQYQHNLYIAEKYIQWATIFFRNIMGLVSFVQPLLPSNITKSREIPTKFDLIAVQGHPRSSILVSIENPGATSYQSLIVTLDVFPIVYEILTFKA